MKTPSMKKALFTNSHPVGRYGGILLHPTSLPGEYGIGDLGPEVYKFMDFLEECEQNLWQVLSIGPTGYGNSPYQCFSAFAGNPIIISPEKLYEIGLITKNECIPQESFSDSTVDFSKVIPYKDELLKIAFERFLKNRLLKLEKEFNEFKYKHSFWLNDYCVFM
ncbi:MAG: 4-alpha-glucanotransferase, partial [Candidatus Thorarchaeota archaeon]